METIQTFYAVTHGTSVLLNTVEISTLVRAMKAKKWCCPDLFLLNQAIVNLIYGIFALPLSIVGIVQDDATKSCFAASTFGSSCVHHIVGILRYSSIMATFLVTFDRYIAVLHPLKFRLWRTKKYIILGISLSWGIAVILQIFAIFVRNSNGGRRGDKNKVRPQTICPRILIALNTFIIGILMVLMYIKIIRQIRSRRTDQNQLNTVDSSEQTRNLRNTERKLFCIACSTTHLFVLTTLPDCILTILLCCGVDVPVEWRKFIREFVGIKSVTDPLIYLIGEVSNFWIKPRR